MINYSKFRDRSLGFRVGTLFRTNACLLEKRLAEIGLCFGQAPYVIATNEKEGQTQDELSTLIRVNRAATARTLKTMEAEDLIVRKENSQNRRQKLVYPTDKSKGLVQALIEILDDYNSSILTDFSDDEKTQLLSLMDRALANAEVMKNDALCTGGNDNACE